MVNEEKTTAASYVINFYTESEQLTHNAVLYVNLISELEMKYKDVDVAKLGEHEKEQLENVIREVRYYARKVSIKYPVIESKILGKKDGLKSKISHSVQSLFSDIVPKRAAVEKVAHLVNEALASSVFHTLLDTSQRLVDQAYD